MSKHSEIYWTQAIFDKSRILGRDGNLVASTGTKRPGAEDHANAAYIVKACNAFPALVEALGNLLRDEKFDDDSIALITTRSKCESLLHSLKSEG